jgi:DNA processing protein
MEKNEQMHRLALSLVKGIGNNIARNLINTIGSAEAILKLPISKIKKLNGVGEKTALGFKEIKQHLIRAEKELKFMEKNKINILFYDQQNYPNRLLNYTDAPLFLFCKGDFNFNTNKIVNVIGTRNATVYGKELTEQLMANFASYNITLVSGLAHGIDIAAHKAALQHNMQNIAVLGHGLDRVYPFVHKSIAEKLQVNGGLISEFLSGTIPDRQNFPVRNRVVAGMTDCTIVIESAISGGAMITAEMANVYNKDIFAFPGRANDEYSLGCLKLIKNHKASLVTCANDIIEAMNWDLETKPKQAIQPQLFFDLSETENVIYQILLLKEKTHIDEFFQNCTLTQSAITSILLQLEMKGILQSLPGKLFKLNN